MCPSKVGAAPLGAGLIDAGVDGIRIDAGRGSVPLRIPCGHSTTNLKDEPVSAEYRSAYGDCPRAGDHGRTPLARGSNIGGRPRGALLPNPR